MGATCANELGEAMGFMAGVDVIIAMEAIVALLETARDNSEWQLPPGAVAFGIAKLGEDDFRAMVEQWHWYWREFDGVVSVLSPKRMLVDKNAAEAMASQG